MRTLLAAGSLLLVLTACGTNEVAGIPVQAPDSPAPTSTTSSVATTSQMPRPSSTTPSDDVNRPVQDSEFTGIGYHRLATEGEWGSNSTGEPILIVRDGKVVAAREPSGELRCDLELYGYRLNPAVASLMFRADQIKQVIGHSERGKIPYLQSDIRIGTLTCTRK